MKPSALYVRADSVYASLGIQCWDAKRDARTWPGGTPCIAHPPCRGFGRLRWRAQVRPDEIELARIAVSQVRRNGGVLEHPEASALWADCRLPRPGQGRDEFGGWTLGVWQQWWGHRSRKATWLYIVGASAADVPAIPFQLDRPGVGVESLGRAARERTPEAFARWLIELATVTKREGDEA